MRFKKLIGWIHLWLGLLSGAVVFVISITGCLYAFIDELKPIVYRSHWYVHPPDDSAAYLPMEALRRRAQTAVGDVYPLQTAEIPRDPTRSVAFRTRRFNAEALSYNAYAVYSFRVYVNPYTGTVLKVENSKWEFFNVVVNLHTNLLLGHRVGAPIVGWSVVLFVVLLLSGLVLWWPRNKRAAKQRFWFRRKGKATYKRVNYDLHNILGFYALTILLVLALTGLVWSFEALDRGMQWLANGGKIYPPPTAVTVDTTQQQQAGVLDGAIGNVRHRYPGADLFYLSFPRTAETPISFSAYAAETYSLAEEKYDPYSGKRLYSLTFEERSAGAKLRSLNYPIHLGSLLGLPGKVLVFLASLIAASLPVTGLLVWLGRISRPASSPQQRNSGIKAFS